MGEADQDVIAFGVRGPEAISAAGIEVVLGGDLIEQSVRVIEELTCRRLAEDRGVLAFHFPGEEEELPVDHPAQRGQVWLDRANAGEGRDGQVVERDLLTICAGLLKGQQGTLLRLLVLLSQTLLLGAVSRRQAPGPGRR